MSTQSFKAARRPLIFGGAALALLAPMLVPSVALAAPAEDAAPTSFGPAVTTEVVVPDGVCAVQVSLGGGFGGISVGEEPINPDDPDNPGEPEESGIQGSGAVVHATLGVQAGDVLNLKVGGNGANSGAGGLHGGGSAGTGGHPGGGGGYTSIELGSELLLLAAGGGSGGGHQPGFGAGGDAGNDPNLDGSGGGGGGFFGGGGSSFVSNSALVSGVRLESNRFAAGEPGEFDVKPGFAEFEWIMCDYNLAIAKSVVGVVDEAGGELVRSTPVFEDGDIARYSVTVTNAGDDPMAIGDTVTLIDDLAVGGTVVSVDGLGDEAVTNTVSTSDRNGTHESEAVIAPAEPSLELEKSADTEKVTKAGQVVTYSFLVTNTGNIELSNIAIDEGKFSGKGKLPSPTCPAEIVQPGDSVTCSAEYVAVAGDLTGEAPTNAATATGETRGGASVVSNESDVEIVTVKPAAPLAVTGGAGISGVAIGGALLLALGATVLFARRRAGAAS